LERKFQSKPFYYKLNGEYALFTDPMSKGGGEKFTYQVPTYQALKGITECIYWKPTLIWYIDEVKVMETIQTETKGIRSLKSDGNDLNYYTYLKNVEYLVKVYFEWNENRIDLKSDRQEVKHQEIMLRSINKGGRRDIFIGTRECMGYVERINEEIYNSLESGYNGRYLSFGMMFHSFVYPDEGHNDNTYNHLSSNFSNTVMKDGIIRFCRPDECEITHQLHQQEMKVFGEHEMTMVDEEYDWGDKK
jgi:CRISPR-associated protein Cas5d